MNKRNARQLQYKFAFKHSEKAKHYLMHCGKEYETVHILFYFKQDAITKNK